jgi:hypothetical protein
MYLDKFQFMTCVIPLLGWSGLGDEVEDRMIRQHPGYWVFSGAGWRYRLSPYWEVATKKLGRVGCKKPSAPGWNLRPPPYWEFANFLLGAGYLGRKYWFRHPIRWSGPISSRVLATWVRGLDDPATRGSDYPPCRKLHSSSFLLVYLHFSSICSHPQLPEIKHPIN